MIDIVLAEDHHVVRQGLRALLEKEPDFRIIGEAADGPEAVDLVRNRDPDVLILDLMMPGINGIEVTRQVRSFSSRTRIIILSMYDNVAYVLETLKKGADGYVLKGSPVGDLVKGVREVMEGRRYLSPPLSDQAVSAYMKLSEVSTLDPYETLTTREREVLRLAAEGLSNSDIADRLSISPRTVEVHRAHMMKKLGLRNQTHLVRYAIQRGILSLEGSA